MTGGVKNVTWAQFISKLHWGRLFITKRPEARNRASNAFNLIELWQRYSRFSNNFRACEKHTVWLNDQDFNQASVSNQRRIMYLMDERLNLTWLVLEFHFFYWYDMERELKPSPSLEGSLSFPSPFPSHFTNHCLPSHYWPPRVQHPQNSRIHVGHLAV